MQYFILGVTLLVAILFLGRWFVDADPRKVASVLKWGGLGLVISVILLLVVSGRIGLIFLMVPLIIWLRRLLSRYKASNGPSGGQSSEVRTRFLQMWLDHDSGELDGEILDGPFAGQYLSQLDLPSLLELMRNYGVVDQQSASVLEAYLDRTQDADWREAAADMGVDLGSGEKADGGGREQRSQRSGPAASGAMTRAEALEMLDLQEGASAEAIREAHHRLMQKLHPDHGGSNYLAAKLNEAKDLLLRH
ncbi:MAG: hypothetical protein RH942_01665 [Kiloniellaceae bacterium]